MLNQSRSSLQNVKNMERTWNDVQTLVASLLQLRVLAGKFNQQEAVFRLACQIALEMFEEKIRFNL